MFVSKHFTVILKTKSIKQLNFITKFGDKKFEIILKE